MIDGVRGEKRKRTGCLPRPSRIPLANNSLIVPGGDRKTLKDNNIVWYIAIAIVPIASLAGLAASMRSGHPLTKIEIASAMLNSGLLGFVVFCLGAHYWGTDSLFLLVGVSVLSGLGGNSAIDFARSAFRKKVAQQLGISDDQEQEH